MVAFFLRMLHLALMSFIRMHRLSGSIKGALVGCISFAMLMPVSGMASPLGSLPDSLFASVPSIVMVNSDAKLERAQAFVNTFTQEGVGFLSDDSLSVTQREAKFRKLLQRNFDMAAIGRFSVGRYWKNMSAAQRKEYLKLFEEMIVRVYTGRFNDYNGERIEIFDARPEGKYDTLVRSHIMPNSGSKIKLDWRVREKKGRFKVIDIIVEGVSMALTQRSDFSSVIQRGGGNVNVLIDHLKK